ncbi:kinase-like domain-containing protein [Amylostereum chailletii]|nr:kinase-like domain-containing protein [Amylostereum chailletii]
MSGHRDPVPALVGKTVDGGVLQLVDVLGSGGFGVVYRAIDLDSVNNQQFAVKVLDKRCRASSRRAQLRELDLHARVSDHPNVVTFHRAFEDSQHLFFVFDACLGGDLFSAITERGLYFRNDELIKRAFTQLIDAVQHCHSNGIFHRDLKPENVLCSADGSQLLLTDFGLASESVSSTTFGIGSMFYMSPECLREDLKLREYSPRHSDIWALGMILVNMITGRSPWRSAVCKDDCFAAYLHDPNFLRDMLPISKPACVLLRRILAFNPFSRISLSQLRAEIKKIDTFFMSGEDIARSNKHVRAIVHGYNKLSNASAAMDILVEVEVEEQDLGDGGEVTPSPVDSEEEYSFASPDPDDFIHHQPVPAQKYMAPHPAAIEATQAGLSNTTTLASSSNPSSAGPITPNTYPVQDVDIADVSNSVEDLALPPPVQTKGRARAADAPKADRVSNKSFVRHAMRKLRIL